MNEEEFVLTDEEVQFYHSNGYLIIKNVFSQEECCNMVAIYTKYAKPDFRGIMNMERGYIEYHEVVGGKDEVKRIAVDGKDAKTVWNMIRHAKIAVTLNTLQKAEVVNLQSSFLFKKAGTPYAMQAWNPHQDNAYPTAPYGLYITGNICFTDQTRENGGMFIFPGSHHEPLLPNIKVKSFHEAYGENPGHCVLVPEQYLAKKVDLNMSKGCVLFLHGNVIHGSYPNNSLDKDRPMLLIPYGTKGISKQQGFLRGKIANRKEHPLYKEWSELFGKKGFAL